MARAERIPLPPAWIDPAAKAEWARVVRILHKRGDVTALDRGALTIYCTAIAELAAAERGMRLEVKIARKILADVHSSPSDKADALRIVASAGRVCRGAVGLTRNPAAIIANQAAQRVRMFAADFGFTPASRVQRRGLVPDGDEPDFPADMADEAGGGPR